MNSITSFSMIMKELESIKNLLNKQNEFLQSLGFEMVEELAPTSKNTYTELDPVIPIENIDYKISAFLQELRIPANIKGYGYLREAIKLVYQDENLLGGVTKYLYPEVAKKFKTTTSRAERAIRHAIETSRFKNVDYHPHTFYEYYDEKPTNSQFIADVVEKFRLEQQVKLGPVAQI